MLKNFIKKFIPRSALFAYHKILAIAANWIYGFPSHRLIVVGVTGTKGKSSVVTMLVRILEEAGNKVGSANTIFFKAGEKEWPNNLKQGMPGRFKLQKLLRKMARAGCTHAVLEVTSEGISQYRHWGIAFDAAVFTNLSPEHIEAHGSFANYRQAKQVIFKNLQRSRVKIAGGQPVAKTIVVNRLDEEAENFACFPASVKWGAWGLCRDSYDIPGEKKLCASEIKLDGRHTYLTVRGHYIRLNFPSLFMAQNAILAMAAALALGATESACEEALEKIEQIPGRLEFIELGQDYKIIIDYAHEPKSMKKVLETGRALAGGNKLIVLFGATGGGRDKAKRPEMGRIASESADMVILTTDDPYDDDPEKLIDDIVHGLQLNSGRILGQNWWRVKDRAQAIKKALFLAKTGDVVMILGKGSETKMAVSRGKFIDWSDVEFVKEVLHNNPLFSPPLRRAGKEGVGGGSGKTYPH